MAACWSRSCSPEAQRFSSEWGARVQRVSASVIGHPERTETVLDDPGVAEELAGRGWALQVNGTSLLGLHGPGPEELAWRFLENGQAALVASDGHRATRPPHRRGLRGRGGETGGGRDSVLRRVCARPQPATDSISRSFERRLRACTSIWRTRSRVSPRRRNILQRPGRLRPAQRGQAPCARGRRARPVRAYTPPRCGSDFDLVLGRLPAPPALSSRAKTASSCSPTGWSRLVDATMAAPPRA